MPSFVLEVISFSLSCSSGSVPSSSASLSITDVILRLIEVFQCGRYDGLVLQLHIWLIAKVDVRVTILMSLSRSRAVCCKETKHIGSLLAGFGCRKDTPGSFAVFSNSLASSDGMLMFDSVASLEIREVSMI